MDEMIQYRIRYRIVGEEKEQYSNPMQEHETQYYYVQFLKIPEFYDIEIIKEKIVSREVIRPQMLH